VVEGSSGPPCGVFAGQVHGDFGSAGDSLTDLIGCDQQDLSLGGVVELELLWIGLVVTSALIAIALP
jgi:hypothetical protein